MFSKADLLILNNLMTIKAYDKALRGMDKAIAQAIASDPNVKLIWDKMNEVFDDEQCIDGDLLSEIIDAEEYA